MKYFSTEKVFYTRLTTDNITWAVVIDIFSRHLHENEIQGPVITRAQVTEQEKNWFCQVPESRQ